MAANPKRLRIVASRALGPRTRGLAIECVEGGAFEAVGGRYVIVHTGLVIDGKAIKRAYSLVPIDGEPNRFELAVQLRGDGPGSRALHDAPIGTELTFSGPWGKLVPESGLAARTLFVATDTGITSALGVVSQEREQQRRRGGAHDAPGPLREVLWLRAEKEDFLDVASVRARVEAAGARFVTSVIPPAGASERASTAFERIDARIREMSPELIVATGDGRVVHPLVDRAKPVETRIECYFHNPEKKSAS